MKQQIILITQFQIHSTKAPGGEVGKDIPLLRGIFDVHYS